MRKVLQLLFLFFFLITTNVFSAQTQSILDYVTVHAAWSPAGNRIATAAASNVQIWDSANGNLLLTLTGHTGRVSAVSWNSDGTRLASASADKTIRIWDAISGSHIRTLTGSVEPLVDVIWTPDNTKIIGMKADYNPTILVWNATTGVFLSAYSGGAVSDIAFSPTGSKFIYVTWGGDIHILDGTTFGNPIRGYRPPGQNNLVDTVAWRSDGNQLVTGSINGLIMLWDGQTAQPITWFAGNSAYDPKDDAIQYPDQTWVRDVAYSPDGSKIMAISANANLRVWDSSTRQILSDTQIATSIYAAVFNADSSLVAYLVSSDGELYFASVPNVEAAVDYGFNFSPFTDIVLGFLTI